METWIPGKSDKVWKKEKQQVVLDSTSANFDQFRLRPISTSANFWMLGPEAWQPQGLKVL